MDNPQFLPDTVPQASELPDNVFLINSLNEANVNLRKLLQLISETRKGKFFCLCLYACAHLC